MPSFSFPCGCTAWAMVDMWNEYGSTVSSIEDAEFESNCPEHGGKK